MVGKAQRNVLTQVHLQPFQLTSTQEKGRCSSLDVQKMDMGREKRILLARDRAATAARAAARLQEPEPKPDPPERQPEEEPEPRKRHTGQKPKEPPSPCIPHVSLPGPSAKCAVERSSSFNSVVIRRQHCHHHSIRCARWWPDAGACLARHSRHPVGRAPGVAHWRRHSGILRAISIFCHCQ